MTLSPVILDGSEQVLYTTPYQYAAGSRVLVTGAVTSTETPTRVLVSVTIRLRVDSPTGTVFDSCSATIDTSGPDAVLFAFAATESGSPVPAHRVVLTIQANTATPGTAVTVVGHVDVEAQA